MNSNYIFIVNLQTIRIAHSQCYVRLMDPAKFVENANVGILLMKYKFLINLHEVSTTNCKMIYKITLDFLKLSETYRNCKVSF